MIFYILQMLFSGHTDWQRYESTRKCFPPLLGRYSLGHYIALEWSTDILIALACIISCALCMSILIYGMYTLQYTLLITLSPHHHIGDTLVLLLLSFS